MKVEILVPQQLIHAVPFPYHGLRIWRPRPVWVGVEASGKGVLLSGHPEDLSAIEEGRPGWRGVAGWLKSAESLSFHKEASLCDDAYPSLSSYSFLSARADHPWPQLRAEEEIARRLMIAWIAYEAARQGIPAAIRHGRLILERDRVPFPIRPLELPQIALSEKGLRIQGAEGSAPLHVPEEALPAARYGAFRVERGEGLCAVEGGPGWGLTILDEGWGGRVKALSEQKSLPWAPYRREDVEVALLVAGFVAEEWGEEHPFYVAALAGGAFMFAGPEDDLRCAPLSAEEVIFFLRRRPYGVLQGKSLARGLFWPDELSKIAAGVDPSEMTRQRTMPAEVTRRVYLSLLGNSWALHGGRCSVSDVGLKAPGLPSPAPLGWPPMKAYVAPEGEEFGFLPFSGRIWVREGTTLPERWGVEVGSWVAARVGERDALMAMSLHGALRTAVQLEEITRPSG